MNRILASWNAGNLFYYAKRGIEKMKKRLLIYLPIIATLVVSLFANSFTSTVSANESESDGTYDFYPIPHSMEKVNYR